MPRAKSKPPCCGPCSQKQRRLELLADTIKRILKSGAETPRAKASLEKALAEQKAVTGWLASHVCARLVVDVRRATRF